MALARVLDASAAVTTISLQLSTCRCPPWGGPPHHPTTVVAPSPARWRWASAQRFHHRFAPFLDAEDLGEPLAALHLRLLEGSARLNAQLLPVHQKQHPPEAAGLERPVDQGHGDLGAAAAGGFGQQNLPLPRCDCRAQTHRCNGHNRALSGSPGLERFYGRLIRSTCQSPSRLTSTARLRPRGSRATRRGTPAGCMAISSRLAMLRR